MKSLRILAVVAVALLAFSSCEEDEKPQNKTSILTSKNWKMTGQTVNPGFPIGNGAVITDFYEQFYEDCDKDNTMKFNENGSYSEDEGATKCNSEDPQTIPGSWAFNTDETIISITEDSETISFTILELTNTTLKTKHTEKYEGINYSVTTIFEKK